MNNAGNADDWKQRANCKGKPLSMFFTDTENDRQARVTPWVAILCNTCEVRTECEQAAIEADEYGIWGGMSRYQRNKVRRMRGR